MEGQSTDSKSRLLFKIHDSCLDYMHNIIIGMNFVSEYIFCNEERILS